ncbi:alanyl-tRNA editing protein [Prodigiosinella confusarubida]|uniref:Alanyl-tRNA editing protein n=1 Tax=Serratia sp. (strain ATCC 39006) TaxID=104623 RepID=A0A2I5TME8_SERS3|nr:alanyl-tRNA editing protein [Serratia sp. ATCC 39006]AUH01416.1 alanyl-tRNA editing protein [Serratia sp. ATCC 39006]AUH05737.1 alanyl-tRNA editing protein [Serratia sp. ATCC 39006]
MFTTIRLFDSSPYESNFTAKVLFVGEDHIILDRTLFYPLSGNQDFDSGIINNVDVTSTYVDVGEENLNKLDFNAPIKHYLNTSSFTVGQNVEGSIDFEKRWQTMRLHSASHIVEYLLSQHPDFMSVEGSFVNHEKDRSDYKLSNNLTPDGLAVLEEKVNEFILSDQDISCTISGKLRFWQCANISMLCCGTHVKKTKEIGQVKLSRKNKGKNVNRIEIRLLS